MTLVWFYTVLLKVSRVLVPGIVPRLARTRWLFPFPGLNGHCYTWKKSGDFCIPGVDHLTIRTRAGLYYLGENWLVRLPASVMGRRETVQRPLQETRQRKGEDWGQATRSSL